MLEFFKLLRWDAHRLDTEPGQHPADATEGQVDKRKTGDQVYLYGEATPRFVLER